jgi:SulP family sulfate permease
VALGVGNLLAPLFGGIAATGALARTATNIRSGAKSPLASVTHALVVLLSIALFAPLVAYVPMASLAALLLLVAYNMSEVKHFVRLLRTAPKSDIFVLVTCFGLTVIFDMVWAVSVGFVLAAVMFMRRMAEITETRLLLEGASGEREVAGLPAGVALYEVNGPLFFGAAQNAMEALHASAGDTFHTLVLHLGHTPVIDATGMAALENTLGTLQRRGKRVVLAGPLPRPDGVWEAARIHGTLDGVRVARDLDEALQLVGAPPTPAPAVTTGSRAAPA